MRASRRTSGARRCCPAARSTRRSGATLFFKCENLQKVAAFKARGACNAVLSLDEAQAARGVVTHSSGNHGAALAWAATRRGIPSWIVMPSNSAKVKQAAVRGFGGNVRLCEPTLPARETTCASVLAETGATLVHPYDDWRVIAGQGTAALELLDEVPDLDAVITPLGRRRLAVGNGDRGQGRQARHRGLRRGARGRRRRRALAARRPHHPADRSAYHRRRVALVARRSHLRRAVDARRWRRNGLRGSHRARRCG